MDLLEELDALLRAQREATRADIDAANCGTSRDFRSAQAAEERLDEIRAAFEAKLRELGGG